MGGSVSTLRVWFWYEGKSGGSQGGNWHINSVKSCDVKKLKKAAQRHHITHLKLEGSIPDDFDQLVPSLTHLKIIDLPKQDLHKLESIGKLSNLQELCLSNNQLTQLPESIGGLSNLQKLDLESNQLTHLPESIGKLGKLQELDLHSIKLTHLPESIGALSNLQKLNLFSNQLTHLPERFVELSNLRELRLRDNKLTHLPESIGELSNLQELRLYSNKLTHLPESIGELSNLQELILYSNKLTHLPESIIKLSKLTELDVHGCDSLLTPPLKVCEQGIDAVKQYFKALEVWVWYEGKSDERPGDDWFDNSVKSCDVKKLKKTTEQHDITHLILEGRMPEDLDQLLPSLTHLMISRLPKQDHQKLESIGKLCNLQELYLRDNKLTHFPESIGKLSNLQILKLSTNRLTRLPQSIEGLKNVQELDLSGNKLTHLPERKLSNLQNLYLRDNQMPHFPENIGELSNLQNLDLSNNQLTHLPESIGGLKNVQDLDLSGNQLTHLPESIGELSKLQGLTLMYNKLNHLPESIGKLSNLQDLYLRDNQLTQLPGSIGALINLQKLYLFGNNLTQLPASIGKLSNLQMLWMSNNNLNHLPESIGELSNLQKLYLSRNKLTHLPESIGKLSNLETLWMSNNKLNHLPESIGNLLNLQMLWMGNNKLHHLPWSIGELSNLQQLYLSSNKLTQLPESIGELSNLQKLYLNRNKLSHLPESIGKLSNLQMLWMSKNELNHLPESIGELNNLQTLSLSFNQLTHLLESIRALSNLQKLYLYGNQLTHLPESIGKLSSLQKLVLTGNQLTHLPESIEELNNLQELYLSNNQLILRPESIGELNNLQTLALGDNQLSHFPDSIGKLSYLQKLDLSGNQLTHLPKSIGKLSYLQKLDLSGNQLTHLPESIGEFNNLQILSLSDNQLTRLPESIGKLSNLHKLYLYSNQLTHLPKSIGKLSNIQELYLASNQLTHLPESIGKLSNIQKLDLRYNKRTHLPESIGELSDLQELYLESNQLTQLPESIGELSNLQKLTLSYNKLTHLPESIGKLSNLHELILSYNKLTDLPESIGKLSNLHELILSYNKLTHLPESIGKLSNLQKLDLDDNWLTHLPESIGELSNLQDLWICDNQLTHLPESIIKLSKLTKLDVKGCTSLHTPPLQVCEQGIDAVEQYFIDLAKGQGKSLPAATIAVMGEKMAGKTSLIRTLQSKEKKRVLTVRRPETGRDDATRVFNIEEVPTDDMILRFVDVGGHEVYHSTYPLTLRDSCVPAIVINLKKYSILSKDKETGKTEAVRSLCFDTLSQLYISNPKLGPPLLILTHIDLLDDDRSVECVREDFVKQCELLRQRLLREDQQLVGRLDGHFGNSNIPLFNKSDIFCIGGKNDSFQVFESIIDALRLRCKKFLKIVPAIWEMIADTLSSSSRPYVKFAELLQSLSESHGIQKAQLEFILIYLHECGKILWYPNVVELKPYVFQSIPELTKLLCVLFAHDDDTKWETRLADEKTFVRSDGSIVEHEEYQAMYQSFSTSGIMDADLLLHLIKSESSFTADTDTAPALAILCQFRLIYGPSKFVGRPSYLSPYFAVGYQSKEFLTTDSPVRMHSQMNFKGLTIPRHVYGRISVDVLHCLSDDLSDDISLTQNGLTIHLGHLSIRFTHDFKSRKATLEIATGIECLTEGRNLMQKLISAIKFHAETAWPATRIVTEITCTHCLLRADPHPKRMINPTWLSDQHPKTDPMKSMICQGERKIPACLIVPCASLTKENMENLKSYTDKIWIKGVSSEPSEPGAGDISPYQRYNTADNIHMSGLDKTWAANTTPASHAHSDNEYDSDISEDGGGLLTPEDELDYVIRRKPQDTWREHIKSLFLNTDKVYEMSKGTRGRALIINIERFNGPNALNLTRTGSSVDVENMSSMLKEFKIELSEVKENLDAQEILGAIREETQHKHHEDYNMFVLCVMTHGKEDEQILGSDQQVVKLKEIYELLSPMKFPAMAGKPKIIVIQACAGDKQDLGKGGLDSADPDPADASHINDPDQSTRPKVHSPKPGSSRGANARQLGEKNMSDSSSEAGNINQLDVDDLLIIRSSFESYSSIRSEKTGSLLIRCLVATLNKHACHRDLYSLCEIVQHRVRTESQKLAKKYPGTCYGQTIVAIKTFTRMRKVYLFPGYNPRADRAVTSSHTE